MESQFVEDMESQFLEGVESILSAIGDLSFLYTGRILDALFAMCVFLLGYNLLRVGLERLPSTYRQSKPREYAKFVIPGALFAVLGTVFLLRGDPALLYVALLALAAGAGLGAVALGSTLILKSFAQFSRVEVREDRRALFTRTAPGAFLTTIGLITTVTALSIIPDRFTDFTLERRETRQEVVNVINARLDEALDLLRQHMSQAPEEVDGELQSPE